MANEACEATGEGWTAWSDRRSKELALDFGELLDRLGGEANDAIGRWPLDCPIELVWLPKTHAMLRILISRYRRRGWSEPAIREEILGQLHDHATDVCRLDRPGSIDRGDLLVVMRSLFDDALTYPTLEDDQPD